METNKPMNQSPPSPAVLFGSSYNPDYLQYLPEVVQFEKPVALIPDFTRTKQLIKEYVQRYDLQLMQKYPAEMVNGKLTFPKSFTSRRLNSGTMATLDAILEMYGAWCMAVSSATNSSPTFKIRPSAIKSRRYGAVKQNNTINDHLERLEESGLITMSGLQWDQSYHVEFNRQVLAARTDKNFTKIIVDNILNQCPELARSEDFQQWQKRLKPSFFAVPSEGGTQFLRAYMIVKIHNSNNQKAESVNVGEPAVPTTPPPFPRSKGAIEPQRPAGSQESSLGPKKLKDDENFIREGIRFKTDRSWDIVRSFSFWNKKTFTDQQVRITKNFLHQLILLHIKQHGPESNFMSEVLLPVLRNQERSLRSGKYDWTPPSPDIYFSPDFLTDDGRAAGYSAALVQYQKLQAKKNMRKGTKLKIKQQREKERLFMRWFEFFARIPTMNNMRKAEEKILQMDDHELTQLFYNSVIESNLLPTKKLMEETQDKLKTIVKSRIRTYLD